MSATPAGSFRQVVDDLASEPGVEEGSAFHAPGVKAGGKIVAMLIESSLVVKLPAARCTELVEAGEAERFTSGKRVMKEWVAIPHARADEWRGLAREAYRYVTR